MTVVIAIGVALVFVVFAIGLALAMAKQAGRTEAKAEGLQDDVDRSLKAKDARDRERHRNLHDPGGLREDDGFRRD